MKKARLLSVLFLFGLTGFSQSKIPVKTEQEIKTLLCHKWKATFLEAQGQKMPVTTEMEVTMTFKNDGTVISKYDNKQDEGRWVFDYRKMTIAIATEDEPEILTIKKISETGLVLQTVYRHKEMMNTIFKRAN